MSFPSLTIGDLVAKLPIVQGGMGVGISLSGLASAVANQGGIGVIAGAMIGMREPDIVKNPVEANVRALKNEIEKARALSPNGILGVNIMVALTTFKEMVKASIESRANIIFSGAGLPMDLPKILLATCEEKKRRNLKPNSSPLFPPPAQLPSSPRNGNQKPDFFPTLSLSKVRKPADIWGINMKR